ncbi:hypothetical protein M9H77_10548 [Catharanthus roseus]|uniref:Uncharacterized protein n=1 Tax=Catharanthus roseus TaxID=4058 RepID=A0ACC0BC29_CATRO|nr:hypothetical protein M9H77_10548 [Catharanthus roseus]
MAEEEEEEPCQVSSTKQIKQSISVPFVWEVIPGTPKKDWKPTTPLSTKPVAPPVKLIASVPFGWEEKPGKPLPYCSQSQPPPSSSLAILQAESNNSSQSPIKLIDSVPYEWNEKPGLQQVPASSPVVLPKAEISSFQLPVKLVASVPFEWEEKPGKPLPYFSKPPIHHSPFAILQAECNSFLSLPGNSGSNRDDWTGMNDQGGDETEMLESDQETCEYETDDGSFSSAPSFSVNSLALTVAIPSQESHLKDLNSGQLQSPGSPASETESTSSDATGTTSLVGASFLEWLFPLLAPRSSFLDRVGYSETVTQIESKKQSTDFQQERNYSATIRRPPTLGELIMMSRRRSYQRKAMEMQKQNLSKEIMKRNAVGCGIFENSNVLSIFGMKWKRQLQLKLM